MKWSAGSGYKKYRVVTPDGKVVQFGDKRYGQYKDRTPLKLYSHLDHKDLKRRASYRKRHNYPKPKYSPGWFALKYLW